MPLYDTKFGRKFSDQPVGDGEEYPPDVLSFIEREEFRAYKANVMARARSIMKEAAEQYGFEYIEEAERSFQGNGERWFYAQLIEEWAVEIHYLVKNHLQFIDVKPVDDGEAFFATLPNFNPNRVPVQVTMFQAHTALELDSTLTGDGTAYDDDKLAQVDAYLLNTANFADIREQRRAQIAWNVSGAIRRDAALVEDIGAAIGYDSAGLDNLFRTAIQIRPPGSGNP